MSIVEIIILAIGLSMDAVAVSISNAICINKISIKQTLSIALSFAIFQGLMPLIGFWGTALFSTYIIRFDHWIALILLLIIGGKMFFESINSGSNNECSTFSLTFKLLMLQAIATSIDALAVGISLSALSVNILYAISIISIITFIMCITAVSIAKRFGNLLGKRAETLGGLILIFIGCKIFIDHMFF
jgi:putative Mn2+ efflux pump MntP